jgi:pyruvate kinase
MSAFRRTKIVATLGPATSKPEMIKKLIDAGVNVFRLNFSHGDRETHKRNIGQIRAEGERRGVPLAVLQDLQGPKIRIATFDKGKIVLKDGDVFNLTCGDDSPGDKDRVGVTYKNLYADVKIGDILLLDDGRLALEVTALKRDTIQTRVTLGGTLSNNKGINIPGADLSIPALTDKDVEDLLYGAELEVDWVAMSFVRSRDDLLLARHYLARAGSTARLMAKIEKPTAVERFGEILKEVDGVMVARGDLGVEMDPERVPLIQKRLIRACVEAGKPVVTATQMLESMVQNPTPTRAEASDVANAIYDGTDAVMLSAETAVGQYPLQAVRIADAVSLGAVQMAYTLQAELIVTFTSSGATALRVARNRPNAPVLAITPSDRSYRQMSLVWGVVPLLSEDIRNTDEMVSVATNAIRETGLAHVGERYVITAGVPFGMRGTTNLIRVERVRG